MVGHHGLRELFRDDFDTFLDNVYRNANEDIRKNIIDRTKGNPLNLREATEEYIAELAERGFDNKAERSLWEKIKDSFLDMLRKAGISLISSYRIITFVISSGEAIRTWSKET